MITSIACAEHGSRNRSSNAKTNSNNSKAVLPCDTNSEVESVSRQNDINSFYDFYSIDAESLDHYNDGAFFPVHLGDLYQRRYRIMLKIGHGSYSTVWLAVDLRNHGRHVALKFLAAREEKELCLHRYLQSSAHNSNDQSERKHKHGGSHEGRNGGDHSGGDHNGVGNHEDHTSKPHHGPDHDGRRYVMPLLDCFHVGKESEYTTLVTPVLIPLYQLNEKQKLQLDMKALLFQLLQGISFLHSKGITHGDLHPGNVTLRVPTRQQDVDSLRLFDQPRIIPVVPDELSAVCSFYYYPKYLVSNNLFADYVKEELSRDNALSSAEIRIIDLTYRGRPCPLPTTHRYVRGPEFAANKVNGVILDLGGNPSDVWSTACTMFTLVFGNHPKLFENACAGPQNLLWEIERKIGPLPATWQLPSLDTPQLSVGFTNTKMTSTRFWEGLTEGYQGPWPREAVERFLGLIRRMLYVDPALRPSIDSILVDEWFDDMRER